MRLSVATLIASAAVCTLAATPAVALQARLSSVEVAPKKSATLTLRAPSMGQFSFWLRAASDGDKRLTLTQRRGTATPFTVMTVPGKMSGDICQGAAGSIYCTGFQTPAPVKATYTFRLTNRSTRPMTITLRVTFKKITSAG